MKKNSIGNALRILGLIVIVIGAIISIINPLSTPSIPNEFAGFMFEPTVTYDVTNLILGLLGSIVVGALLIGLGEIIFILDEQRENSRRLCRRFGIEPAFDDKYAPARKAMEQAQVKPEKEQEPIQRAENIVHEDYGDE